MITSALFPTLDPVTIETQELNVIALTGDNLFVESDPIFAGALLSSSTEDVIDIEYALVCNMASSAGSTKVFDSGCSGRAVSAVPTSPSKFFDAVRVVLAPSINPCLSGKVVASGANGSMLHGGITAALRTEFRLSHDEMLSHGSGKRVEKML